ncbi:hypothetical protein ACFLUG_03140 [Chloroflexota bacterium]
MRKEDTIIGEILLAQERRAQKVREHCSMTLWVKQLRKKFIADGFLRPFYSWDGRMARSEQRINKFGDYVLSGDMAGDVFYPEVKGGWILQESIWFWHYLEGGQEAIYMRPMDSIPESLRIEGVPADQIWNGLIIFTEQTGLFGEDGGGIVLSGDLDEKQMLNVFPRKGWDEGDDGYMEPYQIAGEPQWITQFHQYEDAEYTNLEIETRPAWFHIADHAFFNTPMTRLPVFICMFTEVGKIERIRYLDDGHSDQARDFIGKALLGMPIKVKKLVDTKTLKQDMQEMTWWLWHNVGHWERKQLLSYLEIADIIGTAKSSVQTTVLRFNVKLKDQLDGKLLGRLLRASASLGLGYNFTYKTLVEKGLAPDRGREIDSFDDLDNLI